MDIDPRLYVEIQPFDGLHPSHPHPIDEGHFDPSFVYKVLGMYNPSETSECYFMLVNPQRQIWFIPQRHLLAYRLIDSEEFFLKKEDAPRVAQAQPEMKELTAPPPPAPPPPGSVTSKLARGRISGGEVQVRLTDPDSPQRYGKGF